MADAAETFRAELEKYDISPPSVPVYANLSGLPYGGGAAETLALQMRSPVLWSKSVENMLSAGVDTFIEAGPGNTLSGLIARISGEARVCGAGDAAGVAAAADLARYSPHSQRP
jgi:[acyl-carrier-protein] S-malonyltransferase